MKPTNHTKSKLAILALAAFGATALAATNADAAHNRRVKTNRYQRAKLHTMQRQQVIQIGRDFAKLDKNKDGKITRIDALLPTPYKWQRVGRHWKRVRLHNDIPRSDYTKLMRLADHNKDRVVTKQEYRAQRLYGWKLRLRASNPRLMRGVVIRNPAIYLAHAPKLRPSYASVVVQPSAGTAVAYNDFSWYFGFRM